MALNETSPKPGETAPASVGSTSTADSKATTSKKYFQHVSLLVDSMRTHAPGTPGRRACADDRRQGVLEIDRLPVLNVDEDLLAYDAGGERDVPQACAISPRTPASTRATARLRWPAIRGTGTGDGGFYGGGTSLSLSTSVMRKQETALLKSNQMAIFTMLEEKTADTSQKNDAEAPKVEF